MDASIYKRKSVFAIGEKSSLLASLSTALENEGFSTKWSNKSSDVNAVVQQFHGNHFDLVLFGHRLKPENKKLIMQRFRSQNEQLLFIDTLAAIPELMVAQVKLAFLPLAGELPCVLKHPDNKTISIEVLKDCSLQVKSYMAKWLSGSEEKRLFDAQLQGGLVSIPLEAGTRKQYLVVTVNGVVIHLQETG